jgi:hypothetical protein
MKALVEIVKSTGAMVTFQELDMKSKNREESFVQMVHAIARCGVAIKGLSYKL